MTVYEDARRNMILSQLEPNRVTNFALLAAMGRLPREKFVPKSLSELAYVDSSIEIVPGRHLIAPMVLARMIQESDIKTEEVVLDVACGSGYSTAVVASLAATVVGLDPDAGLVEQATQIIAQLEIDNAAVVEGNPSKGWADQGPYDVILLNGSADHLPNSLLEQLSDGGRLIFVEGSGPTGKAVRYERRGDVFGRQLLFDAAIPAVPGLLKDKGFVF